jgi:hypothetical protein
MSTEAFIASIAKLSEEQRRAIADRLEAMAPETAPEEQQAQPAVPGYPPRRA